MRNREIQITVAIICMILGLMLTVQFKSIKTMNSTGIDKLRAEELQSELNSEKKKLDNALTELAKKEKLVEDIQNAASKNDKVADIMKKETEKAKMLAGLTTVQGQGIIVTLNDSKIQNQPDESNDSYFIIHDSDILLVINELRASGAEAISLNDNRVLSTSEIRCAGPVLSINNTRTSAPFVIKAIGNATDMENALRMRDGVVDALQQWGIEINISKPDNVVVSKYNGALTFNYVYPVKEEVTTR